jgi:hypothetical protein
MKAKKKILIGLGVLVVLIIVLVMLVLGNLNAIVKGVIEKVGTGVTGVPVTVGAVDIKLAEGSAAITQLSVANPEGFSAKPMLDFGELSVKLNVGDKIINQVKIASPHILFEQKGKTSNFQTLQDNMAGDKPKEEKPADEKPTPSEKGEPTILQIDLIEITDAQVAVISDYFEGTKNLTIPSITFKDLKGTGEEVGKQVLGQLTAQIIEEVTNQVIQKQVEKAVGEELGGVLNIFKKKE